jgi:hypothetical protein
MGSSKKDARSNARRARTVNRVSGTGSSKPRDPLAALYAGREQGQLMLYDPNAEQRYKSEEQRYNAAIALSPDVMRPDGGGYRLSSGGRSTKGYWSPGAVRLYCPCSTERYGKVLEFDMGSEDHELVIQTPSEITLLKWTNAPNCEFSDPGFEPIGTQSPGSGSTVRFTVNPPGFYSLEVAGGCVSYFACLEIVNLEPAATIIRATEE